MTTVNILSVFLTNVSCIIYLRRVLIKPLSFWIGKQSKTTTELPLICLTVTNSERDKKMHPYLSNYKQKACQRRGPDHKITSDARQTQRSR